MRRLEQGELQYARRHLREGERQDWHHSAYWHMSYEQAVQWILEFNLRDDFLTYRIVRKRKRKPQ
jgi:uncharacterized protein YcsI (UPF0317 family)